MELRISVRMLTLDSTDTPTLGISSFLAPGGSNVKYSEFLVPSVPVSPRWWSPPLSRSQHVSHLLPLVPLPLQDG